jgi:hypothetical protein
MSEVMILDVVPHFGCPDNQKIRHGHRVSPELRFFGTPSPLEAKSLCSNKHMLSPWHSLTKHGTFFI